MYLVSQSSLLLLLVVGLACCDDQCPDPNGIHPCKCSPGSFLGPGLKVDCIGDQNYTFEEIRNALSKFSGKKIRYLNLDQFDLEKASSEFLNGLILQEVYFRKTYLKEMPSFTGSENTLQEITFGLDAVSEQSIESFTLRVSHLNKLKSFTITYNYHVVDGRVKTISVGNDWFGNGPSSLEEVDLSTNYAKSFGDRAFYELSNLKEIALDGNRIEQIRRSMFPNPAKSLLCINLWVNEIQSLPEDIFSHMPVLEKVDIRNNPLKVLDESTWSPVWEQLDAFEMGLDLICDSTISWTFKLSRPRYIYAYCDETDKSNKEYRGRSLSEIIDEKQDSSSNTN